MSLFSRKYDAKIVACVVVALCFWFLGSSVSFVFAQTDSAPVQTPTTTTTTTTTSTSTQTPAPTSTDTVPTEAAQNTNINTTNFALAAKVAPGESLPVAVKLLNFGSGSKTDVVITYGVFDNTGIQLYTISETVAVETTASFVKNLQIPVGTPAGNYVVKTSIMYQGQVAPAISQFAFTVEPKIFGLFRSDFIKFAGVSVLVFVIIIILGYLIFRRKKNTRLGFLDYSDIPRDKRVFFELLSDTIMQMRMREGDAALEVATHIKDLKIDKLTGRVLEINDSPSKIIAALVAGYESVLGQKVSFSFRSAK